MGQNGMGINEVTCTSTHSKLRVGAGSQVSMKSAMMAITTFAPTKSISFQNMVPRLVLSAVTLVRMPMPHSMPTLAGKDGSASRRSRKPVPTETNRFWFQLALCTGTTGHWRMVVLLPPTLNAPNELHKQICFKLKVS